MVHVVGKNDVERDENSRAVVLESDECGITRRTLVRRWRSVACGWDRRDAVTQTAECLAICTSFAFDRSFRVRILPDVRDTFVTPRCFSTTKDETARSQMTSEPKRIESTTSEKRVECATKIQRFYRSYRARIDRPLPPSQESAVKAPTTMIVDDNRQLARGELPINSEDFAILNRSHLLTRRDFEFLRKLLARWRALEWERASRLLFRSSRLAVGSLVLSKEVELLRAIEASRTRALARCNERRDRRYLQELSRSRVWRNGRGQTIEVDTLSVQMAREYRDLYVSLTNEDLGRSDRILLLVSLKDLAESHTCSESDDLIYLIRQEQDLLAREVREKGLRWLRERLRLSFMRLVRNSFRRCDVVDRGRLADARRLSYSEVGWLSKFRGGGMRKPAEGERQAAEGGGTREDKGAREGKFCEGSCQDRGSLLRRVHETRVVYESYAKLLRDVRRSEGRLSCYTSLAFVIGSKVVYHLVDNIWHGRSGISECDDLEQLRLLRFHRDIEWSPWNSVLLTRPEAAVHQVAVNLDELYGESTMRKFRARNLRARRYFESAAKSQRDLPFIPWLSEDSIHREVRDREGSSSSSSSTITTENDSLREKVDELAVG